MPAIEKPKPVQVDAWETPKETWQYVTVPDEDPLGKKYPSISLNKHVFQAGETYQVPPQVAAYVNDRIKVFNRSCVRLLQNNVDMKSLREVAVGTTAPAALDYIDATKIKTL